MIEKVRKEGLNVNKEIEDFREEIVDRIMDTKETIYVEDPRTGKEATKESLMKCEIDELIRLMEENVVVLRETTEGKIEKD